MASGGDNIPPGILKINPSTTAGIMYDLLNVIWEKEVIPEEWKQRHSSKVLQPLWKLQMYYATICFKQDTSLDHIRKVKDCTGCKVEEKQPGFRPGRSCMDQISTLRLIVEQSIEWQSTLYLKFLDFAKAFDSVDKL